MLVRTGMRGEVFFADVSAAYVGVNLSGGNIGMPQDFLDSAQISPALKHVGGKLVAQRVRMQILNSHRKTRVAHQRMHTLTGNAPAARVEKHRRARTFCVR